MQIPKTLLYSFVITTTLSCKSKVEQGFSRHGDFVENTIDFVIESKDNNTIELPFIYDSLVSQIPSDTSEILILAESLKKRGFKVIDWGRGNYPPRGSRIVSLTLQKVDCVCQVDKIYYLTISDSLYEIAERIKCCDSLTFVKAETKR